MLIPNLFIVLKLRMSGDIAPSPPNTFMAWTGAIFYLCRPACVVNRQTSPIPAVIEHPYLSCVVKHRQLNKF